LLMVSSSVPRPSVGTGNLDGRPPVPAGGTVLMPRASGVLSLGDRPPDMDEARPCSTKSTNIGDVPSTITGAARKTTVPTVVSRERSRSPHRRWNLAAKRSRRSRKIFKTRISTTSSERDPQAQMIVVAAAAAGLPRRGSREWNSSLIAPRLDLSM